MIVSVFEHKGQAQITGVWKFSTAQAEILQIMSSKRKHIPTLQDQKIKMSWDYLAREATPHL